jgi:hypothetical protein
MADNKQLQFKTPEDILEARADGLISSEQGLVIFRQMVKDKFSDERIVSMIDELCRANDVNIDREGNISEVPNWSARTDGLDRVLKIMAYMGKDGKEIKIDHPTKVVFNVVNYQPKDAQNS